MGVRASVTMGRLRSIRVFVVGDARRPGNYTISSLATMTNALFASGGVAEIGSLRDIQLRRDNTIVGNIVHDNMQPDTPAIDVALLAMGNGILVAGSNRNVVERNLVYDHERLGIGLVPFPEEGANDGVPDPDTWDTPCAEVRDEPPAVTDPDQLALVLWDPMQNQVVGNEVSGSGLADLGIGSLQADLAGLDNCFGDNLFTTSAPAQLEQLAPCSGEPTADDWSVDPLDLPQLVTSERPPSVDYTEAPTPEPGDQPSMPDAATAPARPATNVPFTVDLDAIALPTRPTG